MPVQATFSDFKLVKTRKVAQFVLEVPIEMAGDALQQLGGLPQFPNEQWVALVAIDPTDEPEPVAEKPKMTPAQYAGMMCHDESFQRFLGNTDSDGAAEQVRLICGVNSRSEIKLYSEAHAKWEAILTDYDVYRGRISAPR